MRNERTEEVLALRAKGHKVERLSDYQFRINDCIDIYPTSNKYHALKTQKRGKVDGPIEELILNLTQH